MSQQQRIYVVDGKRLVRAPNAAQALRHASKDIEVRVAKQDDLVRMVTGGVKVEDASGVDSD